MNLKGENRMLDLLEKATQTSIFIRNQIPKSPQIAIILGSGLGSLANEIQDKIEIPYAEIPNFPVSRVEGHENKLIYGTIYGKNVIAMKGRFHYYEGYTMQEVAFPIKVFALLGISNIIVSNAAGGINKKLKTGDLMIISDHIKFSDASPLIGNNIDEFGTRFPDMGQAYSLKLRELTKKVAKEQKIPIQEGIYAYMAGPQYETPAEINMLGMFGADAVGMSTVPEVISAVHSGMEVLGISCITNSTGSGRLSHEDVIAAANNSEEKFKNLVLEIINQI
jgi:purine-nucleoside phosphorylase